MSYVPQLQKQILSPGWGATISPGSMATVHYTGMFPNGQVFDSSVSRGKPFTFRVGAGQVIKAWDIGVLTMQQDEQCRLICPPEYAYGPQGSPPNIPPNATLIFDIQLLGWTEPHQG